MLLDLLTGDKKRTFEEGLKKAAHKLDMSVPALSDLPLFQIAETIIAVSVKEEIFPLLCQEFFRLFLQRSVTHASIGDQFFLSSQATRLLKPMKQKLRDAADFYRARGSASDERHPQCFRVCLNLIFFKFFELKNSQSINLSINSSWNKLIKQLIESSS